MKNTLLKLLKVKTLIVGAKQDIYQLLYTLGVISEDKCERLCSKNIMGYLRMIERYCKINNLDFDEYLDNAAEAIKA